MSIDVSAAVSFMATHGRILDQRRLQLLLGAGSADSVLAALDAYRNLDGGYGWGLEPDLRAAGSQPTAAMHAFEVLAEVAAPTAQGGEVCRWLAEHTLADGGLPFALPVSDPSGCAPFWAQADPTTSSLMMTAQVAAKGHLVARHDPAVAEHPWLVTATQWCLDAIRAVDATPHAYELLFALEFLDAASDTVPDARALLDQLGRHVPPGGAMHVEGGTEDETLYPLDFSPQPDRPLRSLFADDVIAADLDRLAALQQPDGGWVVDFVSYSPAAALEWRGYTTVRAITVLRNNASEESPLPPPERRPSVPEVGKGLL
ncbi:MAG: hypothetical protein JWP02_1391 [Acidimicrobiales bacterium]|nr:hypothetical protein [Acidimicrobiales bacterium]